MAPQNRVKASRLDETVSRAEFARLCGLSEKTIARIEADLNTPMDITTRKLVNGFNSIPNRRREYTIEYLFPDAQYSLSLGVKGEGHASK